MSTVKVAITIEQETLKRLDRLVRRGFFPNRSRAIRDAVELRLRNLDRGRLARECAKLNREEEAAVAEEGMSTELEQWAEY